MCASSSARENGQSGDVQNVGLQAEIVIMTNQGQSDSAVAAEDFCESNHSVGSASLGRSSAQSGHHSPANTLSLSRNPGCAGATLDTWRGCLHRCCQENERPRRSESIRIGSIPVLLNTLHLISKIEWSAPISKESLMTLPARQPNTRVLC